VEDEVEDDVVVVVAGQLNLLVFVIEVRYPYGLMLVERTEAELENDASGGGYFSTIWSEGISQVTTVEFGMAPAQVWPACVKERRTF
jgi:hypothetical protein